MIPGSWIGGCSMFICLAIQKPCICVFVDCCIFGFHEVVEVRLVGVSNVHIYGCPTRIWCFQMYTANHNYLHNITCISNKQNILILCHWSLVKLPYLWNRKSYINGSHLFGIGRTSTQTILLSNLHHYGRNWQIVNWSTLKNQNPS